MFTFGQYRAREFVQFEFETVSARSWGVHPRDSEGTKVEKSLDP